MTFQSSVVFFINLVITPSNTEFWLIFIIPDTQQHFWYVT